MVVGQKGGPVTRQVVATPWSKFKARLSVGRPDLHLHDLRHSGPRVLHQALEGLTWSATAGATTAELMHRAGHESAAAALRYQHATEDRDRVLADALAALVKPSGVVPLAASR